MIPLIGAVSCLIGSLLMLISAVGLFRFPDIYTRIHATGIAPSLGLIMLLIGAGCFFPSFWIIGFIFLMITINFLTSPLTAHLIARAAYRAGLPLWGGSVRDEFKFEESDNKP